MKATSAFWCLALRAIVAGEPQHRVITHIVLHQQLTNPANSIVHDSKSPEVVHLNLGIVFAMADVLFCMREVSEYQDSSSGQLRSKRIARQIFQLFPTIFSLQPVI